MIDHTSENKLFFDTDCISAFLWIKQENILTAIYSPDKIIIPDNTYTELKKVPSLKKEVDKFIKDKNIQKQKIEYCSEEYKLYKQMTTNSQRGLKKIGKGEAASLALTIMNDGIIASNNLRDIEQYINKFHLAYKTTGLILLDAYNQGILSEKDANIMWREMLKRKRKLGAETFSEYKKNQNQYDKIINKRRTKLDDVLNQAQKKADEYNKNLQTHKVEKNDIEINN